MPGSRRATSTSRIVLHLDEPARAGAPKDPEGWILSPSDNPSVPPGGDRPGAPPAGGWEVPTTFDKAASQLTTDNHRNLHLDAETRQPVGGRAE